MTMFNNSDTASESFHSLSIILTRISVPYVIIVALIGIGGNVLTLFMLFKRTFTKNFNNCTLIALALTDLLFNLMLVSRFINDITNKRDPKFCRVQAFLSHLAELLSACFTVHFTAQRFLAVRFPLSVIVEKRAYRLQYLIVGIFTLVAIIYCHQMVISTSFLDCYEESHLKWFISDALLSFVLPFTIITILNLLIIRHLRQHSKNAGTFLASQRQLRINHKRSRRISKPNSTLITNSTPSRSQNRSDDALPIVVFKKTDSNAQYHTEVDSNHGNGTSRSLEMNHSIRTSSIRSTTTRSIAQSHRVTRMLILVSTCFLLLNAPSHICTIGVKIYNGASSTTHSNSTHNRTLEENNSNPTTNIYFAQFLVVAVIVTQHIAYASYSINFFLYSFCGMKFRRELAHCFFCRKQSKQQIYVNRSLQSQNSV